MDPPFKITTQILKSISKIERLIGRFESLDHAKPQPYLRKSNRIRTVQCSLAIEGNTLSLDQITALIEGKTVIGKKSEIQEVLNAVEVYDQMSEFKPHSFQSLLKAHRIMMTKLIASAGKWRLGNVGILKGSQVSHIAPPAENVPHLMKQLFEFLKKDESHELIKSAVFHYELEFIHPFEDGNGRIGRFWHSLLLTRYHPAFEFTPVESLIKTNQKKYYKALGIADKAGDSTSFIEFSLDMVQQALADFLDAIRPATATTESRLDRAKSQFDDIEFSRKDYMKLCKNISTATASRDLKAGVNSGILEKKGQQALTNYRFRLS
jgi:Fic family protein